MLVSNRGRISGSGRPLAHAAEPGAPLRAVHDEETTWKARPDWARDGRRVGLRVLPGPAVAPALARARRRAATPSRSPTASSTRRRRAGRPDGARIAYVSNEDGAPALWTIGVPGGERRQASRSASGGGSRPRGPAARRRDRERPLRAGARLGHDRRTAAASRRRAPGATPTTPSTGPSAASSTATSTREAAARARRCRPGPVTRRGRARARVPAGAPHARRAGGRDARGEPSRSSASPTGPRAGGGAATCTCT